jgi:hypothetical protein
VALKRFDSLQQSDCSFFLQLPLNLKFFRSFVHQPQWFALGQFLLDQFPDHSFVFLAFVIACCGIFQKELLLQSLNSPHDIHSLMLDIPHYFEGQSPVDSHFH